MEFIKELKGSSVSGLSQTNGVGLVQRFGLSMT
jgi:hypothetical protein